MRPPHLFSFYHTDEEHQSSQKRARPLLTHKMKKTVPICSKSNQKKAQKRPPLMINISESSSDEESQVMMHTSKSSSDTEPASGGKLRVTNCHAERLQMVIVVCIKCKVIAVICY